MARVTLASTLVEGATAIVKKGYRRLQREDIR
jgi:hypothetical protein